MAESVYHIPAMLAETIQGLNIRPEGVYVDVTLGGGGHSREILKCLDNRGTLYSLDQDEEAICASTRCSTELALDTQQLPVSGKLHGLLRCGTN